VWKKRYERSAVHLSSEARVAGVEEGSWDENEEGRWDGWGRRWRGALAIEQRDVITALSTPSQSEDEEENEWLRRGRRLLRWERRGDPEEKKLDRWEGWEGRRDVEGEGEVE
jgi:hypothetical protein